MSRTTPEADLGYFPQYTSLDVASLRDVNLLGLVDGNALLWDEANDIWTVGAPGAASIGDLDDVTLTAPALNEVLAYDGADWVNVDTVTLDTVTATGTITGGTVTDGTISMTGGALTGLATLNASGTITAGTLTDGTASMTAGGLTGLTSVTAGTVTDGIASMSGGDLTNVGALSAAIVFIGKSTVTQITSATTPVTINAAAGSITTVSQTLGPGVSLTFTVNNSAVSTGNIVIANVKDYGGGTSTFPYVYVNNITNGSFDIVLINLSLILALSNTVTIDFVIH